MVCRQAEPVTYAQLHDVMGNMGWLDKPARFDPPVTEANGSDPEWRSFEVRWDASERPISVGHVFEQESLAIAIGYVEELLDNAEIEVSGRCSMRPRHFLPASETA